jgi:hypothetical protein
MRGVAAWLVARPQNAILALCITMLVPVLQPVSSAILVMLVLAQGPKRALFQAALAGIALLAMLVLAGNPVVIAIFSIMMMWLPVFLLAWMLASTRSFTLTMQVSAIVAIIAAAVLGLVIDDAATFWQPYIEKWSDVMQQAGGVSGAATQASLTELADSLGAVLVVSAWFIYSAVLMLGYLAYARISEKPGRFGWIRELNFGRILAFTLALVLVLSYVSSSVLLESVATVLFAIFFLQATALVYWIGAEWKLPGAAAIAVYVISFVSGYVAMAMMVIGYLDAWFNVRHLVKKT